MRDDHSPVTINQSQGSPPAGKETAVDTRQGVVTPNHVGQLFAGVGLFVGKAH